MQLPVVEDKKVEEVGRNPCFTGILNATELKKPCYYWAKMSQSLFYWNTQCNPAIPKINEHVKDVVAILVLLEYSMQLL